MEKRNSTSVNQVWDEELLSSGATSRLEDEQESFNAWLQNIDEDQNADQDMLKGEKEILPSGIVWSFEKDFEQNRTAQDAFFQYVADHIHSVQPEQYLLRFLLERYALHMTDADFQTLWELVSMKNYRISIPGTFADLEKKQKSLQEKLTGRQAYGSAGSESDASMPPLEKKDCNEIMSVICGKLRNEFPPSLASRQWTTFFRDLFTKFTLGNLHDLALGLDWDWKTYQLFRSKALKKRGLDFLDREEVLLFLSLRYSNECGYAAWEANHSLHNLYPAASTPDSSKPPKASLSKEELRLLRKKEKELRKADTGDSSIVLENKLLTELEDNGKLRPEYRDTLFSAASTFLTDLLLEMQELKARKVKRSPHVVLMDEWDRFSSEVNRYEYTRDDTESGQYAVSGFLKTRHELYRWLYGNRIDNHTYTDTRRGIQKLTNKKYIPLAPPGAESFFLDSEEFYQTMLRDAVFNEVQPISDEMSLRSLILTVGFLNFVYSNYGQLEALDYQQRLSYFEYEMRDLLNECGFLSLHSGAAYDAFLKLLLSCDDPFSLFRYIWHMKTGSPME